MMCVSQSGAAQLLRTGPGVSQLCLRSLSQLSCCSRDNPGSECFSSSFTAGKAPRALKFWSSVPFPNFKNPWKWGDILCEGELAEFTFLLPKVPCVVCTGGAEGLTLSRAGRSSLASHSKTTNWTCPPSDLCSSAGMRSSQIQRAATLLSENRKKSL